MSQIVVQVFAKYNNQKGFLFRPNTFKTGIAKGVQRCSSPGSKISQTALSSEKRSADVAAR